ncbi:MAG: aspartate 1-decarboxylase [Solirubrobacterales bacterium]
MLKSEIDGAVITDCDLNYVGSLTLDSELMSAARIAEFELVAVANLSTGARFETYAMRGAPGSGTVQLNGAAARLGHVGDSVNVYTFAELSAEEASSATPAFVRVTEHNQRVAGAEGSG